MRLGYRVWLYALLLVFVLVIVLGIALGIGVLFSKLVDHDVAVEMFKAIIQVDGFLIGFAGVLATFVLADVAGRSIAFSVSEPHRAWVLVSLFTSVAFLLLSIVCSLSGMSGLHDYLLADSGNFFFPLSFLIAGVCYLCVVASTAMDGCVTPASHISIS